MSDAWIFAPELKPWEKPFEAAALHGADYAATAVFSIVEIAYELVREEDDFTGKTVGGLAKDLAGVLIRAQAAVGPGGWSSKLNSHLRGALRTALKVVHYNPTDRDTPAESYAAWLAALEEDVVLIARAAHWLYQRPARELAGA